jgi:hypothetical protein
MPLVAQRLLCVRAAPATRKAQEGGLKRDSW